MATITYIIALVIIVVIYLASIVVPYIKHARKLRRTLQKLIPTPGNVHWLAGHLLDFRGFNEHGLKLYANDWLHECPRYYLVFAGPLKTYVILNHPETVKALTKTSEPKQISNYGGYQLLFPWIGDGLLLSKGEKWSRNRKMLTHGFHFDVLKPYLDIYNQCVDTLLDILDKQSAVQNRSIDIFQPISRCALDIVLRCAFSTSQDVQRNENNAYLNAVSSLAKGIMSRAMNPLLYGDTLYFLTPGGRSFRKSCDSSHKIAEDVMDKRKMELENSNPSQNGTPQTSTRKRKCIDFLDILLLAKDEAGEGLSRQEILDEVKTFMFEGHDTTTSGISWCLYNLARHPDIQAKALQEIDALLDGRASDHMLWGDMSEMPYLTQCIKESMRLHPPVPFVGRQLTKPLLMDGKELPIDTELQISIINVHHNPEVWKDPMTYDPDRFHPDNMTGMDSHAFVGFSAGPRNCIGQNFAMNEMKTTIARILHRFEIRVDTSVEVKRLVDLVLRTENGIHLYFNRRKNIA